MAYTDAQARQYYDTLPATEKAKVDASGGPSLAWFTNAVNAGAPDALKVVGGKSEGGSTAEEGGNIADWKSAAPSSEWLGKRKPTAQELRRWANETGRPEDYNRYPDAAVSGWIDRNWDVNKGTFVNNYGDSVDKPDERGPNTPAGKNGTGDAGAWAGGAGEGEGTAKAQSGADWTGTVNPDLQEKLVNMFKTGGGAYSETPYGMSLANGGMITSDTTTKPAGTPRVDPTAVKPTAGGSILSTEPGQYGGINPDIAGSGTGPALNPALMSATLNAFTPQAPSQQQQVGSQPQAQPAPTTSLAPPPQATPEPSQVAQTQLAQGGVLPVAQNPPSPQQGPGQGQLTNILKNKYGNPNKWWAGPQTA